MMTVLASMFHLRHNLAVLQTKSIRGESRKLQAGRTATIGGIFSSQAMKPSMGGVVGCLRARRVPVADLSTHHCRPPSFESDVSGVTATTGGQDMANLALRTSAHNQFPFTSDEARHAARLWFVPAQPSMTLAEWRDHFLHRHLTGIRADDWRERLERTAAWNAAFNDGLAAVISGGASHE